LPCPDPKINLPSKSGVPFSPLHKAQPLGAVVPVHDTIVPFGTTAPSGWALCNGENGTPDLLGRFILGSGQGKGLTNRTINTKDGTETHKLTVAEMPSHNHGPKGSHNHNT
jgi:microcystin-dependent protein